LIYSKTHPYVETFNVNKIKLGQKKKKNIKKVQKDKIIHSILNK